MKSIKINIPNPCTENWENMTQQEQGKHCAACNKVVIDFTKMTETQIAKYLWENKDKKICGNFYNTQLTSPINFIHKRKKNKWPAIAAMLVAGIFQLNNQGWSQKTQGQVKIYNKNIANEKSTITNKNTEPANDSLITYTIQVLSEENKKPLYGISVMIDSLGSYTTDKNGQVILNIDVNKIPNLIEVQFSSLNHVTQNLRFSKISLVKSKRLEIFMKEVDNSIYMLKGDVNIDYHGR